MVLLLFLSPATGWPGQTQNIVLPEILGQIPWATELPCLRHRWNTNEVCYYIQVNAFLNPSGNPDCRRLLVLKRGGHLRSQELALMPLLTFMDLSVTMVTSGILLVTERG